MLHATSNFFYRSCFYQGALAATFKNPRRRGTFCLEPHWTNVMFMACAEFRAHSNPISSCVHLLFTDRCFSASWLAVLSGETVVFTRPHADADMIRLWRTEMAGAEECNFSTLVPVAAHWKVSSKVCHASLRFFLSFLLAFWKTIWNLTARSLYTFARRSGFFVAMCFRFSR